MRLDHRLAAWLAFAAAFLVYLLTMNRTIGFIDRGELAAVAWNFGIPHATGYPTLMLLGGIVSHLTPLRPVLALNILAALLVAAGVAVLVLLFDRVLGHLDPMRGEQGAVDDPGRFERNAAPSTSGHRPILALAAALVTASTLTWWQQANGFEVYALHALLMPLAVLMFVRWLEQPDRRSTGFWFALVTGLSFTNHGTTVLLAPGMIAAAMFRLGVGQNFWRRLPLLVPPFLLGLLPYAWLPFRAAMNPRFNSGDPSTPARFLHHVTGADYHDWIFGNAANVRDQLAYILWRLPWEFSWIGVVIGGFGLVLLIQRAPWLAAMTGLFVVAGIALASGYGIMDLDAYLLTALLGFALLLVAGAARIAQRYGARVGIATLAIVLAINLAAHWRECDESGNRMVEQMALDQIGPLPENAVLVSTLWEIGQSASLYFQTVEGCRPDVLVVDPGPLRASWYLDDLARRAPELICRIPVETAELRGRLEHVEAGGSYVSADMEAAYRRFLSAFVRAAARDRPVFVTSRFPWIPQEIRTVPYHLVFWLRTDEAYVPESEWSSRLRLWTNRIDAYVASAAWLYGEARLDRAQYEAQHGRMEQCARALSAALSYDPNIQIERVGRLPLAQEKTIVKSAEFYGALKRMLAFQAR